MVLFAALVLRAKISFVCVYLETTNGDWLNIAENSFTMKHHAAFKDNYSYQYSIILKIHSC